MPTKIGRTFSGRRKQLWPFALPVTANDLWVPAGMEPRFVGCKSFALSTEWRLHWAVCGCFFELSILPLWDKGNCTDFADNSRSCRSILVKFFGGWMSHLQQTVQFWCRSKSRSRSGNYLAEFLLLQDRGIVLRILRDQLPWHTFQFPFLKFPTLWFNNNSKANVLYVFKAC